MQIFIYLLIAWFLMIAILFSKNYHKNRNRHFLKWKMVNNWGKGGNSVRRNVSSFFRKK